MSKDSKHRAVHSMGGWPIVAILAVVLIAGLMFALNRQDRATKLRVGSGTAQAMYDGSHTGNAAGIARE